MTRNIPENYEAALKLFEENKFNSCVNRLYYSMFTLVLDKIEQLGDGDKVRDVIKKIPNKHKFTTDYLFDNLLKNKIEQKDYISLTTSIEAVKVARHKADYSSKCITEKNARSVLRHGERFREILNKF